MSKNKEKEFEKALEFGLKSHPMASTSVEINPVSQAKLKNLDDQYLIALAGKNLQNYILTTCREIAIQRELRRRKRALPPFFVKAIVDEFYEGTLGDEDLCNVEEFKVWYEKQGSV